MKGFTLVEVLGVLILLGVFTLITVPIVTSILKDNTNTLRETQITNIKNGASDYVAEHLFNLDLGKGKKCSLTIKTLKDLGYLEKELIDPKTNANFDENTVILVENKSGNIDYTVCLDIECNISDITNCES